MNMKCQFTLFCFNIRVLQGPSIIWIPYLPGSLSQVDVVTISCRAVTGLSSIVGPGRQLPQILLQIRIIIDPQAGLEPGASPSLSFTARKKGEGENRTSVYRSKLRMPCDSATDAVENCVLVGYIYDPQAGPGPAHTVTVNHGAGRPRLAST